MSKSVDRRLGLQTDEGELSWEEKRYAPYRYHVLLTHQPTGMVIEQASETSASNTRTQCMAELHWRFRNWDDYQQSLVRVED